MAETTKTTTVTKGGKTTSTTTVTGQRKGAAWVRKGNKWVKPKKPAGDVTWNDDRGWVSKSAYATDYSFPLAIIKSDKELSKLFNDAWESLKGGTAWTEAEFKVKLQRTNWFKTRSEAQQKYHVLSKDPAQKTEFKAQIERNKADVAAAADAIGITLSAEQIDKIANENLLNGWNASQLEEHLADYITFQQDPKGGAKSLFGKLGEVESDIRNWAKRNGISIAEDWLQGQIKESAKNNHDITSAKAYITNIAKQRYSNYANLIDDKNTAEDAAAGLMNSVQNIHEVPAGQLDINDKRVQQLMTMSGEKGGPISTWDAEKWLRKQPAWMETKNARESITGTMNNLLSKFGF